MQDSHCKNKAECQVQVQKNMMHVIDAGHVTSFTNHVAELQVENSLRSIKGANPSNASHKLGKIGSRSTEKEEEKIG